MATQIEAVKSTMTVRSAIASYPNLHKPKAMLDGNGNPTGEPKFSVAAILNKKTQAAQIKEFEATACAVAVAKWGKAFDPVNHTIVVAGKKTPVEIRWPLRDGEEKEGKKGYNEDVVFFNASADADHPPEVVDAHKDASGKLARLKPEDGRPYAGCLINLSVRFFAYDNKWGKGVSAGLGNVQFVGHGERLGGGEAADREFEEIPADEAEHNPLLD